MAMNFVDQLAQRACGIPTLFDELKSDEGGPHKTRSLPLIPVKSQLQCAFDDGVRIRGLTLTSVAVAASPLPMPDELGPERVMARSAG
jgi:hypothetical protein